jgi:hypothetical protein
MFGSAVENSLRLALKMPETVTNCNNDTENRQGHPSLGIAAGLVYRQACRGVRNPVILILRNPKYFVSTKRNLLEPLITAFAVKYTRIRTNQIMKGRTYWIHFF